MKKSFGLISIVLFLTLNTFAQKMDTAFQEKWKDIDTLILDKNLPKTALAEVNTIYREAQKNKLEDQVLKALLYRIYLQNNVEETDKNTAILALQEELSLANSISEKAILHSILAKQYLTIYYNDEWEISKRSATLEFKKEDINTWSQQDFIKAVTENFNASLEHGDALKTISLKNLNAIILKGNTPTLRPTLFDLLAHQALDYYKNGIRVVTEASNTFNLNNEKVFAPAESFSPHNFNTSDSLSSKWNAIRLFQQLLVFHQQDKDSSAFIEVDLERISWLKQQATIPAKDSLYKSALESLVQKFPDEIASQQAWYLLIMIQVNTANDLAQDPAHQFDMVKVKGQIEQRLKAQPAPGEGNSNMQALLNRILAKEAHAKVEQVNVPNQPFRLFLSYKNIDTLYYRIISKATVEKMKSEIKPEELWSRLPALAYLSAFEQPLPNEKDYRLHSLEMKMDALPIGEYLILASSGKQFATTDKLFMVEFFVSNLALMSSDDNYFAVNRDSGEPLKNVVATFSWNDWSGSKNIKQTFRTVSDKNGFFSGPSKRISNRYMNLDIVLSLNNDRLQLSDYYYGYNDSKSNDESNYADQKAFDLANASIYFFTDRAIYRPGQLVFFKGIGVTKNFKTKETTVLTYPDPITIFLYDVNGNEIDSLECRLNEFGSITGHFKLPDQVLPGRFTIEADDFDNANAADFRVEEYKRPRFFIQFDKLQNTFQLNDTVSVTGHATAFAGNAMDGARVQYTVTRVTRFIYPWYFWKMPMPQSPNVQIAQGELQTNTDGTFLIPFKAIPDLSIAKNTQPIFDYEIKVTVMDINGETHELQTTISIGYQSLFLQINAEDQSDIKYFQALNVTAANMAGEKQDVIVDFRISPLQTPATIKRTRYWERPDLYLYTKNEYEKYFPYDEYADENDIHTWPLLSPIVQGKWDTKDKKAFPLDDYHFKQGWYLIEVSTTDKNGDTIRVKKFIELTDENAKQISTPQINWNNDVKTTVQPGDTAVIEFGSIEKNIYLVQSVVQNPGSVKVPNFSLIKSTGEKIALTYKTTSEDRKGVGLFYAFVKHNRFYKGGSNIFIPYTNKDLQIKYTSFRNKMEPGSKETWTVQVLGNKAAKVNAELCTAMYDASLDQFIAHQWDVPPLWTTGYVNNPWADRGSFKTKSDIQNQLPVPDYHFDKTYDQLVTSAPMYWMNDNPFDKMVKGKRSMLLYTAPVVVPDGDLNEVVVTALGMSKQSPENKAPTEKKQGQNTTPVQIRKNFNETAFFFPQLHADSLGNFSFSFTMPETLTQWKWLSLSHTKDLAMGYRAETGIVTQKKLMVQPNLPRFLREGDQMELSTKISNLSDSAMKGVITMELFDAETMKPIDGLFNNVFSEQYFSADAGKSMAISFPLQIPFSFTQPLAIRFVAKANQYTDGEENVLSVLSNRIFVTESLPLFVKGDTTQEFVFEKLANNQSATLQTQSLTVEYTANPVWYAIQAMPYLAEFPYECAEQVFNRYYANAIAGSILDQHPRIKEVIEKWQADTAGQHNFLSNLQKNTSLKQVILEETPWVMNARDEAEQRKNIALLFDLNAMQQKQEAALAKLKGMQLSNGAFPWFSGGYPNRYITQYILTGIGRLKKLQALNPHVKDVIDQIATKALQYLDEEVLQEYKDQIKNNSNKNVDVISNAQIQYMYMRSYFTDIPVQNKSAYNFYFQQCMRHWNTQSNYMKAMIGMLLMQTHQERFVAENILASILENGIETKDRGMYWKDNVIGYHWYNAPIEVQSLFIELTQEAATYKNNKKYDQAINEMKTWLLLQKQTNHWTTTKATADACFALLWKSTAETMQRNVSIQLGDLILPKNQTKIETGSGYWQEMIDGKNVTSAMGKIRVTTFSDHNENKNKGISFGAIYWQYFENIENVTAASSPLSITKNLYIETNKGAGKVLQPVNAGDVLHIGDKVILRMVLKSDRDLEYIHLKDGRASAMEPLHVLSGYQWQDGLGYYEATKDASTDFFIDHLKRGTYVFEYPVYITQKGTYSIGIANIQCMYAPEFSAHSNGLKIVVE